MAEEDTPPISRFFTAGSESFRRIIDKPEEKPKSAAVTIAGVAGCIVAFFIASATLFPAAKQTHDTAGPTANGAASSSAGKLVVPNALAGGPARAKSALKKARSASRQAARGTPGPAGVKEAELRNKMQSATQMVKSGKIDAGMDLYKQLIKSNPERFDVVSAAVDACTFTKSYSLATRLCLEAPSRTSDPDNIRRLRAKLERVVKDDQAAQAKVKMILEASRQYHEAQRKQAPLVSIMAAAPTNLQVPLKPTSPPEPAKGSAAPAAPVAQMPTQQTPLQQNAAAQPAVSTRTRANTLPPPPNIAPPAVSITATTGSGAPAQPQQQQTHYVQSYNWKK